MPRSCSSSWETAAEALGFIAEEGGRALGSAEGPGMRGMLKLLQTHWALSERFCQENPKLCVFRLTAVTDLSFGTSPDFLRASLDRFSPDPRSRNFCLPLFPIWSSFSRLLYDSLPVHTLRRLGNLTFSSSKFYVFGY